VIATPPQLCQQAGGLWNGLLGICHPRPRGRIGVRGVGVGELSVAQALAVCTAAGGTPATDGSGGCTLNGAAVDPNNLVNTNAGTCAAALGTWSGSTCTFGGSGSGGTAVPPCPTGQTMQANGTCAAIVCPSGQTLTNGVCTASTGLSTGAMVGIGIAAVAVLGVVVLAAEKKKGGHAAR
jgi:hypothetical protein